MTQPRRSVLARSRLLRPAQAFVATESAASVLLLAATLAALAWANSPWDHQYVSLWRGHSSFETSFFEFELSLLEFVNSGLMAVFFYVVALEIKREFLDGELASPRRAALPIVAAAGGMVVPAALYLSLNLGGVGARGWGIPIATDIAFAMGVLTLLGRRVPFGLKVFLLALAIVDDLGAIAVIAVFYSDELSLSALGLGGVAVVVLLALRRTGVRSPAAFLLLALLLWLAVFKSGVHATVAGVLLAMLTPRGQHLSGEPDETSLTTNQPAPPRSSLADTLERRLHPWVGFAIVPLFALANAGIAFDTNFLRDAASSRIAVGVVAGLAVGKVLGITVASLIAVRLGIASLPDQVRWRHIVGAGLLGGIGFTVSLFVASLAFADESLQQEAKAAVFVASLASGIAGYTWLRVVNRPSP